MNTTTTKIAGEAVQADAPQKLCSICHGYGRYQDGDSGTESDGYAPNIVECECAPEERFSRPDSFEDWASDYGFHAELLDVHQYALEAARDAWHASRAAPAQSCGDAEQADEAVTLPKPGETWHVRIRDASALATFEVIEVSAGTVLVKSPGSYYENRYEIGDLKFVEAARAKDSK